MRQRMLIQPSCPPKPTHFRGSSRGDLRELPKPVRVTFGRAIWAAQTGRKVEEATPLQGFGGAGVLEVVEDYTSGTYRAVYTLRFEGVVYELHVFQKKSRRGIETPADDMALIRQRLREAEEHYTNEVLPTRRARGGEG